jgi:NAD(P)-dependent dehydrogenase (short-subunit alcohol dehydrogenase family)
MARVFITGSADGLGLMAARLLLDDGHEVLLHARSQARAAAATAALPAASGVVVGDLSSIEETRSVAAQVNERGQFDAVIHNAGVGNREPQRIATVDGLEHVFAINVLAPYVLTALIAPPARLVYLSSGLHRSGSPNLDDLQWANRRWNGSQAYNDSKLFDVALAFAVARLWPEARSNSIEPGWVATKMGGPSATDDLALGAVTQAWLAVSSEPGATVSGEHFFHQQPCAAHPAAHDVTVQSALLDACAELTGIEIT